MSSGVRSVVAATACVLVGCGGEAAKEATLPDGLLGHVELESSGGSTRKDWSMSQYDATGSGFNDKENKLKRNNVGDLEVKWVFDDEDASEPVTSINANPVVADGTTFVGTVTGRFFAIDEDGQELWKFTAGPASPSIAPFLGPTSPIFAGALLPEHEDTVIVGDSDGRLSKLDRATGAVLWSTDVDDNDLGGFWGNSLMLAGDTIYAGLASFEPLAPFLVPGRPCCSHRGGVVAVDVATGAVKWRYESIAQSEQGQFPQALIDQLGGVETFGPSGGDVWSSPTFDRKTNTVYISTGQLFSRRPDGTGTGTFDAIIAMDADSGHEKWKRQFSDNLDVFRFDIPFFDPATGQFFDKDMSGQPKLYELENGRRVVAAGQKNGELHVVDAKTGALVASTKHLVMVTGEGGFQSGGAMDGDRLYEHGGTTPADPAMILDGVVMALNRKGTKVLWSVEIPGSALYGSVAVAGGVVYFQSPFEDTPGGPPTWALYAVHSGTGQVLNRITFPNQRALNGPAVSRGRVYAGFGGTFAFGPATPTAGGGVVCLGLPD